MSDVTQWEFDEQRAMEQEITSLRADLKYQTDNSANLQASIDGLHGRIRELEAELAEARTPNLVWDFDDPENSSVDCIEDAVYQHIDWYGDTKVGDEITLITARKLPNVTVRITSVNDDGEVTFEEVSGPIRLYEKEGKV